MIFILGTLNGSVGEVKQFLIQNQVYLFMHMCGMCMQVPTCEDQRSMWVFSSIVFHSLLFVYHLFIYAFMNDKIAHYTAPHSALCGCCGSELRCVGLQSKNFTH